MQVTNRSNKGASSIEIISTQINNINCLIQALIKLRVFYLIFFFFNKKEVLIEFYFIESLRLVSVLSKHPENYQHYIDSKRDIRPCYKCTVEVARQGNNAPYRFSSLHPTFSFIGPKLSRPTCINRCKSFVTTSRWRCHFWGYLFHPSLLTFCMSSAPFSYNLSDTNYLKKFV